MFDTMTDQDLLHAIRVYTETRDATHAKMIDPATLRPLISPMSDDWRILAARHREMCELNEAAYAELLRREQEARRA